MNEDIKDDPLGYLSDDGKVPADNAPDTTSEEILLTSPEAPTTVPQKEVKKPEATRPWSQEGNPWAQDVFRLKKKHQGFRPRFVDPANISRKRDEGWTVANCEHYNIHKEEGQTDSVVRRRGMILMEMPEVLAKQRDTYFKHKTELQSRTARGSYKDGPKAIGHDLRKAVKLEEL